MSNSNNPAQATPNPRKTRKATHPTPSTATRKDEMLAGFICLSDEQQRLILELIEGFVRLYPRDKAEGKATREARQ